MHMNHNMNNINIENNMKKMYNIHERGCSNGTLQKGSESR